MPSPLTARCPHCHPPHGHRSAAALLPCPFCGQRPEQDFARSARLHSPAVCRLCSTPLTPLESVQGNVCSSSSCRQQQLGEQAAARRNAQAAFAHAMSQRGRQMLSEQATLPPEQPISLAIVPVNTRSVTPLPDHRKQAFLTHLRGVVFQERQSRDTPTTELTSPFSVPEPVEPPPSPAQDRLLGLACAVCRGHCCRQGVEHAFQDLPSMRRIRQSMGEADDHDLIARYAELLPEFSYDESCVFHTERGCNLPREMRSDMCNTWMCAGQHRWLEELPREGPLLAYVAATPDYEPQAVRAALAAVGFSPSETLLLHDVSAAADSCETAAE